MFAAPSPLKRERDDVGAVSSEEDYFTPDSSASPASFKKPKSPSSMNEAGDATPTVGTPAAAGVLESNVSTYKSDQLERIFKNLRLRRIVKENHSSEINQMAFCLNPQYNKTPFGLDHVKVFEMRGAVKRDPMDNSNVLGTTGGPQANVYDNEHCGDHLDIMSHFLLDPVGEEGAEELPEMLTCCWMHQPQDAIFVTAGTDKMIHVLSLARSKELVRLSGHSHTVTDIQPHPAKDECLLSASKDGTVRMWNILTGKCLLVFEYKASAVCFNPGTQGHCIRFAKGKVLSKSVNGKVEYWDPETLRRIRTFSIKNTASNQCRFDVSLDELFFCVGTSNGSAYIYNIETGRSVAELKHRRSTKAIRTCVFSRDSRAVICAGEDSFIWRYDYVTDEALNEWAAWKPEA
ncbi:hypothetical protein BGZ65_007054 [Modicella reniformis]|uniref:Uncharacterized protein n=1 Tax=Modicella reniformis TaxID=1440133 RepID=A0A9P6MG07_9FUNG|nr:hypothetical protein BGZ65_007054 [Modicella reniformis]